jgi:hypothetical protein
MAPRVHNSGHWTEAACAVSQFEQHIRAITGLPLGNTERHSDCVMENLIGDEIDTNWRNRHGEKARSSITTARLKRAPAERWAMSQGSVKRLHNCPDWPGKRLARLTTNSQAGKCLPTDARPWLARF